MVKIQTGSMLYIAANQLVKLTEDDYQKIIRKYGTFTNGVKTLLQDARSAHRA